MKNKKINTVTSTIIILIFLSILINQACSRINFEFFGLKFGSENEKTTSESESGAENDNSSSIIEDSDETEKNLSEKNDISGEDKLKTPIDVTEETDISKLRFYFTRAINYYKDQSYLIAEYYLNKIKDDYLVLQDHIYYYLAKSLLMQEKYTRAEEYYLKLIEGYPDSIWLETVSLEYADIFYIKENYAGAEIRYSSFISNFPDSSYMPYCLFQLGICQEKNGKNDMAFENYKQIWLKYPLSEYSEMAWEKLIRPAEQTSIEPFVPTAAQIYHRGEIFFSIYHYHSALDEFNRILQQDYVNTLSQELHSKTLFQTGMCYFRLRDYDRAKSYLTLSYEKHPSGSLADDSLYYTGMALTSLNMTGDAIFYYQKLVSLFPSSNFSDDALYRTGRIYSLREDFANAAAYFKRVSTDYPSGDKRPDALWELGLIQYREGDYSSAKNTFSGFASSYKGTSLEEKGLFWQAKCHQKLGENSTAAGLYQKIVNLNYYSYYTFAAAEKLKKMNTPAQIKKINNELNPDNPEISDIIPDIYQILEEDYYTDDSKINSENSGEPGSINHINRAIELLKLEFFNSASLEIEASANEIEENPARILEIATLYLKSNNYSNSINIIGKNLKKLKSGLDEPHTDYLYYLYYPYGYSEIVQKYSSQFNIDPLFTLAVIRQESNFMPDAISYAGAQGLMQIMPSTGEGIAVQLGMDNFNANMLINPEVNIRMGTFYLRQQLDNFEQNLVYCAGAYNGGPGRMSEWISRRGNKDIDEFIESISYEQTRDYVKKVMGNYYFYQMLY